MRLSGTLNVWFYDVTYDQSVWCLADLVCVVVLVVSGVCGGVQCLGGDLCFRCWH